MGLYWVIYLLGVSLGTHNYVDHSLHPCDLQLMRHYWHENDVPHFSQTSPSAYPLKYFLITGFASAKFVPPYYIC